MVFFHLLDELHRVADVASLAELVDEVGVGGGVGDDAGGDHELDHADRFLEPVGFAEVVEELGGVGWVWFVAFCD